MSVLTLILIIPALLIVGILLFIFYIYRLAQRQGVTKKVKVKLPFQWRHVAFPAIILIISLIMAACFYPHLPSTDIAIRFSFDGTPANWMSREAAMAWMLGAQLFLLLLAVGTVYGMMTLSKSLGQTDEPGVGHITPQKLLFFMGNIVGLPQCVVCFAMFDSFWYSLHQAHIMPMWIFLLIVLLLAAIIPLLFIISAILGRRKLT